MWEELPQDHINKAVANFTKRLTGCAAANGGHFEHGFVQLQACVILAAPKTVFSQPPTYYRRLID